MKLWQSRLYHFNLECKRIVCQTVHKLQGFSLISSCNRIRSHYGAMIKVGWLNISSLSLDLHQKYHQENNLGFPFDRKQIVKINIPYV